MANSPETPQKRQGDGSQIGVPPGEPRGNAGLDHPGERPGNKQPAVDTQEGIGSALHPPQPGNAGSRFSEPGNSTTPPPDARTDWPRGTGELGAEGLDPAQPLKNNPTPGAKPGD